MALLEISRLTRSYYGVHALRGVDLSVQAGRITGLIGPNGAGKTTLFNCISGLVPPDSGSIRFNGRPITRWRPDRITAAGLVRSFQIARGFPAPDRAGEPVAVRPHTSRVSASCPPCCAPPHPAGREAELRARAYAIAQRLNLTRVLHQRAAELSGGQKKLLEIGRALMAEPTLLLLDEPVAGVNPTLAREIGEHLRSPARRGHLRAADRASPRHHRRALRSRHRHGGGPPSARRHLRRGRRGRPAVQQPTWAGGDESCWSYCVMPGSCPAQAGRPRLLHMREDRSGCRASPSLRTTRLQA